MLVELPKPDREARLAIFQVHTQGKPLAPEVDLGGLAERTEGLVGADIEGLCRQAAMLAIREFLEEQGEQGKGEVLPLSSGSPALLLKIAMRHFEQAMLHKRGV